MIKIILSIFFFLFTIKGFSQTLTKDTVINDPPIGCVDNDTSRVFTKLEIEPEFPGGEEAWIAYIKTNQHKDLAALNGAPEGDYTVMLIFIVSIHGVVENVRAETHNGFGMEEEAIRLLQSGPFWKPGRQNGCIVTAYKRIPVKFVVRQQ
ncbi:energy transducer TonB [Ferruginibacter albus]|uniref:energy transducer TonB n=1 Tax=Ferruginibacter albus TaxID=2875540 RepID=UPI001CC7DB22|nr:energy transducer TonB [Ferruginibacter albus]UAY51110.1 energy transducer TonB [Ferruginibacter albus]